VFADPVKEKFDPALTVAQTEVNADYKNSSSVGFQSLAAYIFGNNQKGQKMAMTAPVIQQQEAVTLPMTAPVIQQKSGSVWLMSTSFGFGIRKKPSGLVKKVCPSTTC
jgi:hypothetical protein